MIFIRVWLFNTTKTLTNKRFLPLNFFMEGMEKESNNIVYYIKKKTPETCLAYHSWSYKAQISSFKQFFASTKIKLFFTDFMEKNSSYRKHEKIQF